MTEFFHLLDQTFTLFSHENQIKKFLINFSLIPAFEAYNFTSGWVQHWARWETGDSRAVMSLQELLVLQSLYSSVVSF